MTRSTLTRYPSPSAPSPMHVTITALAMSAFTNHTFTVIGATMRSMKIFSERVGGQPFAISQSSTPQSRNNQADLRRLHGDGTKENLSVNGPLLATMMRFWQLTSGGALSHRRVPRASKLLSAAPSSDALAPFPSQRCLHIVRIFSSKKSAQSKRTNRINQSKTSVRFAM